MIAPARSAGIIAVGTELLSPTRTDTNSLFLTGRLNEAGIRVRAKAVVGDDAADLSDVVRGMLAWADVLILTGGLGPTSDDITRETVASVLGLPLDEDAATLAAIQARFARRGWAMPSINRRQALVPRGAMILPNPNGTAPGLSIDHDGRRVLLLPGPPRELQPMFDAHAPSLLERFAAPVGQRRRVIRITGRSESQVEEIAQPIYSRLSTGTVDVATSILASPGQIELHLTGAGSSTTEIDDVLAAGVDALASALAPAVFSTDGRSLEAVTGQLLAARGWRVAVAESCTGGLLLARLTEVPGSSAWVTGGVVAYDNAVKVDLLGVPAEAIAAHGAVSDVVGRLMAEGVRRRLAADVSVAITGIAGPDGGSAAKPVGTVVIACDGPAPSVRTLRFSGDRQMVRALAVAAALDLVRRVAEAGSSA